MGVYDQIEEINPEDYEELEKVTTTAVNEFVDGNIQWDQKPKCLEILKLPNKQAFCI